MTDHVQQVCTYIPGKGQKGAPLVRKKKKKKNRKERTKFENVASFPTLKNIYNYIYIVIYIYIFLLNICASSHMIS